MAHEEARITIDRPVDVVFNFLADGMNNPRWRTSVTDSQPVPGRPGTYKQGMKGPGGRVDGDYEITELKANESISIRAIAGMVRPTAKFLVEARGDSTVVTWILHFEGKGPAKLMDPLVTQVMRQEMSMLPNLKACLEAQAT